REVPSFSRILIETSGLADPAPVAQLFLNNPLLGHYVRLDAIIAMVDGTGDPGQIEQFPEALKQIAIADRLLVSKSDLVATAKIDALVQWLRKINPGAALETVVRGAIDPSILFGAGLVDPARPQPNAAGWLNFRAYSAAGPDDHEHHHFGEIRAFCFSA